MSVSPDMLRAVAMKYDLSPSMNVCSCFVRSCLVHLTHCYNIQQHDYDSTQYDSILTFSGEFHITKHKLEYRINMRNDSSIIFMSCLIRTSYLTLNLLAYYIHYTHARTSPPPSSLSHSPMPHAGVYYVFYKQFTSQINLSSSLPPHQRKT